MRLSQAPVSFLFSRSGKKMSVTLFAPRFLILHAHCLALPPCMPGVASAPQSLFILRLILSPAWQTFQFCRLVLDGKAGRKSKHAFGYLLPFKDGWLFPSHIISLCITTAHLFLLILEPNYQFFLQGFHLTPSFYRSPSCRVFFISFERQLLPHFRVIISLH